MLNKLQSHIESEETRWQSQLRQKENEVTNLRVELNDMQAKLISSEEVRIMKIFLFCLSLLFLELHRLSKDIYFLVSCCNSFF